jgi:hypothetical protein
MSEHPGGADDDDSSDDEAVLEPTLRDAVLGKNITAGANREIDRILAQMRGKLDFPDLTGLSQVTRGLQAASEERQRVVEEWRERQQRDMDEIFEQQRKERRRELDWQNGLLEQQRLTVAALTEMKNAQDSDRAVNVWVLWIAAASLLATLAGVVIALAK